MYQTCQDIKQKMEGYAESFSSEETNFQRFVIVHDYFVYLQNDPLTKKVLQDIFDETITGTPDEPLSDDEYLEAKTEAVHSQGFWFCFTNLEVISEKMSKLHDGGKSKDKAQFENLCRIFSKAYSNKMLELSFQVVTSEISERLNEACFFNSCDKDTKTFFDEDKSILYIRGRKVPINIQDKITNAHKILHHIFITNKNNVGDDFYYAEIAEDEFHELNYRDNPTAWERYHSACRYVNNRVEEITKGIIPDFLICNTGKKGHVSVNKKYL